ncbi:MAG: exodeoxyribonuclease VII large subunit [Rickettsia sp.]|nr:exodeoxyribonuclease VII large subunit [Rickettsia sp.]
MKGHCFSVSELSSNIRKLLEEKFSFIKVKGEISGLSISNLGHCYFNLKDSSSLISVILWKYKFKAVNFELVDGMEVIIYGKITSYVLQSKYQILADKVENSGVGSYLQMLEKRKESLRKEGIFDLKYKKKITFLPKKIAIITSLKGSVIQDILHRVKDRCPLHVMLYSVPVQGEGADIAICQALDKLELLENLQKPDAIIIARGGGSIEDLMAFNSELLVRKVFQTTIPVVSAIGHETDYSLLDLVADLRAPTPTAAVELVLPVLSELKHYLQKDLQNIQQKIKLLFQYKNSIILQFQNLSKYLWTLNNNMQKFDHLVKEINGFFYNSIQLRENQIENCKISYSNFFYFIETFLDKLDYTNIHIYQNVQKFLNLNDNILTNIEIFLEQINIDKTLKRGFILAKNFKGELVESVKHLTVGQTVNLEFIDGIANTTIKTFSSKKKDI